MCFIEKNKEQKLFESNCISVSKYLVMNCESYEMTFDIDINFILFNLTWIKWVLTKFFFKVYNIFSQRRQEHITKYNYNIPFSLFSVNLMNLMKGKVLLGISLVYVQQFLGFSYYLIDLSDMFTQIDGTKGPQKFFFDFDFT